MPTCRSSPVLISALKLAKTAKMAMTMTCFAMTGFALMATPEARADQGTVGRVSGTVEILFEPSDKPKGEGPFVAFEGKYYRSRPAKVGARLNESIVIKTGAESKLLLIYPNGDMVTIGANSFSQVRTHANEKPAIRLIQGAVRSQVMKGGAMSNMEVSAGTASMGVRGTDFFVKRPGAAGDSELVVLRGEVAVQTAAPTGAKTAPVAVKAGERATTPAPQAAAKAATATTAAAPNPAPLVVVPADRPTLIAVQQQTAVAPSGKGVEQLEAKAAANVLADIKQADPELYKRIEAKGDAAKTSYALNTLTVAQAFEEAPAAPTPTPAQATPPDALGETPPSPPPVPAELPAAEVEAVFALSPPCEPPTLDAPAADQTFEASAAGTALAFSWEAKSEGCSYEWQIAASDTFQTVVAKQMTAATRVQWEAAAGVHVWRVRAINADGRQGLWTASRRVTVAEPVVPGPGPAVQPNKPREPEPEPTPVPDRDVEPKPEPAPLVEEAPAPTGQPRRLLVGVGLGPVSYKHDESADGRNYHSEGGGMRVQLDAEYRPAPSISVQAQLARQGYDSFEGGGEVDGTSMALSGRYLYQGLAWFDLGAGVEFRRETVLHHTFSDKLKTDELEILYPMLSIESRAWPRVVAGVDVRYGLLAGSNTFDVRKDSEMMIGVGYRRQWFSWPLSLGVRVERATWKMSFREDGGVGDGRLEFERQSFQLLAGWPF